MGKQASDQLWVARAERFDFDAVVCVTGPTTPPFSTTVKNISQSGALIRDCGQLQVGDVAFVHLPSLGEVACTLVRRTNKYAGLRFAANIELASLVG